MIPEIGNYALILAMLMALVQGLAPLIGVVTHNQNLQSMARPAATMQWLMISIAFVALTIAFVQSDFSVLYVAEHSNTLLPMQYKIAAVWGGA